MKLTIEFSKSLTKRIHSIRQRMEIKEDITVIAKALALYELLTLEVTDGKKVLLQNEDGDTVELDIT